MNTELHREWFKNFVTAKIGSSDADPAPLLIKLKHTMNVLANARQIAASENFPPVLARISELAALYHDLSRFDQFLIYGTFKDKESRNHGAWSVKLLKTEQRLANEPDEIRLMIFTAVGMHNRLSLPESVRGDTLLACNAVRDADKLDILRVMDEHLSSGKPYNPTVVLGLPDDPELAGEGVISAAMQGKPASYQDLRSVNDFRLLLGTWYFGMSFPASRRMFRTSQHARRLVGALPDNSSYKEAKDKILKLLGQD